MGPAQAQPDVVLGQRDARQRAIDIGLVPAQPEQLRRREARQRAVAGQRDQAFEADRRLDLGTFDRRALVVPEDRGTQRTILGIECDKAVHLTREADSGGPAGTRAKTPDHRLRRLPPIPRVLLGPADARC
jgi:hypothetical protein